MNYEPYYFDNTFLYFLAFALAPNVLNSYFNGLRHMAIMMRLTIGRVDALALAKNARTSQQMIDKFYASHLKTSQVRKQLHAFPNEQAPKAEEAKKKTAAKKSVSKKAASKKTVAKKTPTKKTTAKKVVAKKKVTSELVS